MMQKHFPAQAVIPSAFNKPAQAATAKQLDLGKVHEEAESLLVVTLLCP